jgi:protein-S-isoprenylcysteine O-methyltransferase Ste14
LEKIMTPALLFRLAWGIWALSWLAGAVWTGRTVKRASTGATWLSRGLIVVGAVLLFSKTSAALHAARLWHVGYDGAWALGGLVVLSLLFAWWARLHLGKLWSGTITRKEGHYVVDTGPYALVRHPIYSGAIAATLATAAAEATLPALIGLVLITLGLWLKARVEERFLREELGPEAYDAYRRRVPMLLPFGPRAA